MGIADTQQPDTVDVLVIGGGINGTGIARDAAGRGLSVLLCEQEDLAQHTSSASTKLIHGGLRYLEHYDFALVRHALKEREVLLRSAPHIIWPLRFILPHHQDLRPRWLIRLGLFLYDSIGGRKLLPRSNGINLRQHVSGEILKADFKYGFEYSDCWVQDARLVVLNARDAKNHGADIRTRTRCTELKREGQHWLATLSSLKQSNQTLVKARSVINATGPWVEKTLQLNQQHQNRHGVRLIKGSHIVIKKRFDHPYPYILQHADGRIVFAIPYERDYTLLGTTDIELNGEPGKVQIDRAEIDYICNLVNEYFKQPVTADDVIWSYSGVRPLFDDAAQNASQITRDYVLQLDGNGPPIISVFGGKITTYRKLSEQVVDMLKKPLQFNQPGWTETAYLPGGDIENADFEGFLSRCRQRYPWLDEAVLFDYARNYGTDIHRILANINRPQDMGEYFGAGLYQCELDFLIASEWAETVDDVLWRRTKKGLLADPAVEQAIQQYQQRVIHG